MILNRSDQASMLELARRSIRHGLDTGRPCAVELSDYPVHLQQQAASFVTLNLHGRLRGCIGRLEAVTALVADVAHNAFAAAFRDPRFPPLSEAEWPPLDIHISILTSPEPISVASEEELLEALVPGRDGLIIEDRGRQATFLPSVWDSLPEKREFLRQLRLKAGLPPDHWSPQLQIHRYETLSFPAKARDGTA